MTEQQTRLLEAIRVASHGGLTTRELAHLNVYANWSATNNAVRRLERRGLVRRTGAARRAGGIIWATT